VRITDNRYLRDLTRLDLARRLIEHRARTKTIAAWTQLSPYRIRQLCRDYGYTGDHRGVPPKRIAHFWRSPQMQIEAASLAGICKVMGVLPRTRIPNVADFTVPARGERLCQAYEAYLDFFAKPQISIEHAVLLVTALCTTDTVSIGRCVSCNGIVLVDLDDVRDGCCVYCAGRMPGYERSPLASQRTRRRRSSKRARAAREIRDQVILL
jgi:hypothetical protein